AAAPSFISEDGRTGLITAAISGGETKAQNNAKHLSDELVHDRDGVRVRVGGEATVYWQGKEQTRQNLLLLGAVRARAAGRARGIRDSRCDGVAARDLAVCQRVDLRAEPDRRDGHGVGHRL